MNKKSIILFFSTAFYTLYASPGPLNEIGCHNCEGPNCKAYGLKEGEWHCHREKPTLAEMREYKIQELKAKEFVTPEIARDSRKVFLKKADPGLQRIRIQVGSKICHAIQEQKLLNITIRSQSKIQPAIQEKLSEYTAASKRIVEHAQSYDLLIQPYALGLNEQGQPVFTPKILSGPTNLKGNFWTFSFKPGL